MQDAIHQIDEVIHQKIRLGIMTMLAAEGSIEFVQLKERLSLTDGNLSSHISMLEKNEFLTVQKAFVNKRPQTTLKITKKGRQALKSYLDVLRRIIEE